MARSIIDDTTGEVIEENEENMALAKTEINSLAIIDEWLDRKEELETAKERFETIDRPFRRRIAEIFDRYRIRRFYNDYIDIVQRNGFERTVWNDEKLVEFIRAKGGDPEEFREKKWIDGHLQIKYKE